MDILNYNVSVRVVLDVLKDFLFTIWLILPVYISNAAPVILAKLGYTRSPIDFGRNFIDGRRIFGSHKTIEGFLFGTFAGGFIAILQHAINYLFHVEGIYTSIMDAFTKGLVMGISALTGDLISSFIKRRMGLKEGSEAPLIDQLGFILFAIFIILVLDLLPLPSKVLLIPLVILTVILHKATNYLAYKVGLKHVPW